MKNPQSAIVTILNKDVMTPEMFAAARKEHTALVAVAEKAQRLLDDVESMARLLAKHADISIAGGIIESNIRSSKEAMAALASVRDGSTATISPAS